MEHRRLQGGILRAYGSKRRQQGSYLRHMYNQVGMQMLHLGRMLAAPGFLANPVGADFFFHLGSHKYQSCNSKLYPSGGFDAQYCGERPLGLSEHLLGETAKRL